MKILHAGNMVNLGYFTVKYLREKNIDSELLMEKNPPKTTNPLLIAKQLNNEFPTWIRFYDKSNSKWKFDVLKIMREKQYDLIHAYVELPIFAYVSRKPFLAHTQGSDLRELAFSNSLRGILLRRAYHKAKAVLFYQADYLPKLPKLKIQNAIFLPPIWNSDFYIPTKIPEHNSDSDLTLFHPANLDWRLKGNDLVLRGFATFSAENPDTKLILVDRGIDSKKTHELIDKLGISDKIQFVSGPLNSTDMLYYYNLADIVIDQFVVKSMGSIAWEVMCCEKPLITSLDLVSHQKLYGESPPICNAISSEEIHDKLEYLKNKKIRNEIGKKGRNWFLKYHNKENYQTKLLEIYEKINSDKPLDEYFVKF